MSLFTDPEVQGQPSESAACKVCRFLADPEFFGMTGAESEWLAGQLAMKAENSRHPRAFGYEDLAVRFRQASVAVGRTDTVCGKTLRHHVRYCCQ